MIWYPHLTVATIVEHDGSFLVVEEEIVSEQKAGKLVLNQPAGHLDEGETLQQAAIRETLEETGWLVEPTAVLGVSLYPSPANGITYQRISFIAKTVHYNSEQPLDEGIVRAVWMTLEEVENNQARLRSPMVLEDLRRYLAGERYPLSLIQSFGF
ncbi:NUDIX hydrolase [Teredinibacter waterburyi]|jgi:ADP-ribose pyrophosphatase|uniref:NUDIX hydrolase n=1 Tax=Teredinibacter waterburyi TaxID=1500538 RepID=UPI00165F1E9F|nr:NUDIX hydrolase [Teredinibacter waterburyi]